MKKFIYSLAVMFLSAAFTSCDSDNEPAARYEIRVLTFEDTDYKAGPNYLGFSSWSSLIDEVQYGGKLLYPTDDRLYKWSDDGNTYLCHELTNNYFDNQYWGDGHAVSNYVNVNLADADYTHQLEVYVKDAVAGKGGHNGSANFAVHNGYVDFNSEYHGNCPAISFSDGNARVIDHLYVAATAYLANYVLNSGAFDDSKYFKITATGFDANGDVTGDSVSFTIASNGKIIDEWTKWDLSSLGAVQRVEFNIDSNDIGQYGLNAPGYFAYDDVAVVFPLD